jgi:hypothetical protein
MGKFNRSGNGNGGKREYTSVRLTGLFGTKKPGLYVGNARAEEIEQLVEKCNAALDADKGLTFFLFKNKDRDSEMAFSLSADVQTDFKGRKNKRSERIDEDDEEQEERPRKSRRDRDEEDEEEDRPKSRKKSRRDEDEDEEL